MPAEVFGPDYAFLKEELLLTFDEIEMKRREGVTVWKQKNGEDAFVLFES